MMMGFPNEMEWRYMRPAVIMLIMAMDDNDISGRDGGVTLLYGNIIIF